MRDHHHVIDANVLQDRILQLESEHSGLDRLIDKMSDEPGFDDLELQRLKKRKLNRTRALRLATWQAPGRHARTGFCRKRLP
jgi:hypothetical protein